MAELFHKLLICGALYMGCVIVIGAVFDHARSQRLRALIVGMVCAIGAGAMMSAPPNAVSAGPARDAVPIAAAAPFVLVGSAVGGPIAAALTAPVPIVIALANGTAPGLPASAATLIGAATGLGVWTVLRQRSQPLRRRTVVTLATFSPFVLMPYALTGSGSDGAFVAVLPALLAFLPFGTVLFGFALSNELIRSKSVTTDRSKRLNEAVGGCVPPGLFRAQLAQQWRLYERDCRRYAYLLVSIDDGPAVRHAVGEAGWEEIRTLVARTINATTRAYDLCTAVDDDRFAVLLADADVACGVGVALRIQSAIHDAAEAEGFAGTVDISVGCADADGTMRPDDIASAAEGELFIANARTPKRAISPAPELVVRSGPVRSFPGAVRVHGRQTVDGVAHAAGAQKVVALL